MSTTTDQASDVKAPAGSVDSIDRLTEAILRQDTVEQPRSGMRLLRFEVLNWGTFNQRVWRLDADGGDVLLTGNVGAGKSTIVDGLSILLNPPSAVSFNLAAGAGRKERSLRTYVRGACRNLPDEMTGGSRPQYLRPAAGTVSVLLAVFGTSSGKRVSIGMLMRFVNEASAPTWTYLLHDGELTIAGDLSGYADMKRLMQGLRSRGVRTYTSYTDYAKAMCKELGLRSPAALALFNQTVAMKSVGNLTDFVRQHMLETPATSRAIDEMLAHYADLTRAHDLVVDARKQIDALEAVASAAARLDESEASLSSNTEALEALPQWVDTVRVDLITDAITDLDRRLPELASTKAGILRDIEALEQQAQDLTFRIRQQAGSDVTLAENAVTAVEEALTRARAAHAAYAADAQAAGIVLPEDAADFARFTRDVVEMDESLTAQRAEDVTRQGLIVATLNQAREELAQLDAELSSAASRPSNIPDALAQLRDRIADEVGLPPSDLPFVGELIQVTEGQDQWQPAIERLMRPFGLSLLVPQEARDHVASWVDSHHLGQRLVYLPVPGTTSSAVPAPAGTIAAKVDIRRGSRYTAWVEAEVNRRFQHVCVQTAAELSSHERAVTLAGQVRDGVRREKDDRTRVDDRRRYILGWDTTARRQALTEARVDLVAAVDRADAAVRAEQRAASARRLQETAVARLLPLRTFDTIDVAAAQERVAAAVAHLDRLKADPRLAELTGQLTAVQRQVAQARAASDKLTGSISMAEADLSRLRLQLDTIGTPRIRLSDGARALLEESQDAARPEPTAPADVDAWQGRLSTSLIQRSRRLQGLRNAAADEVVATIGRYAAEWPMHVVDVDTTTAQSRTDLLARRAVLLEDDLPRFERDFREQLETHAINNIAVFARHLESASAAISERVDSINAALRDVDYQAGTVIALTVDPSRDLAVREFRRQLRDITTDVTGDPYSEDRFLAVRRLLDRFAGRPDHADEDARWTRHVADVRNWHAFAAEERTREDNAVVERYSDSDGKSGGQKERLAYTILAASLAYQYGLADPHTREEAFRFAMIDEAFGRGSDDSTRFGLEMFERLGLQLLVVTPLQKTRTIENYVEAVGFVDQRNDESRLLSMTIEEFRARRSAHLAQA